MHLCTISVSSSCAEEAMGLFIDYPSRSPRAYFKSVLIHLMFKLVQVHILRVRERLARNFMFSFGHCQKLLGWVSGTRQTRKQMI